MNQFLYTITFCLKNFSYLFILALPLITIESFIRYSFSKLDINESMSDDLIIESLMMFVLSLTPIGIVFVILSISLNGALMVSFNALEKNKSLSINEAYLQGLKKFFPLLGVQLVWFSVVLSALLLFGNSAILLLVPAIYFYARLGMYPAYIMFQNKQGIESLSLSWNDSSVEGIKLFILTVVFLGFQLIALCGVWLFGIDTNITVIIFLVIVKYFTLIPLFYLFYTLYKSLHPNNI